MERIRKRDLFRAHVVHKRIRGWPSGPAEPPRINICWVPPLPTSSPGRLSLALKAPWGQGCPPPPNHLRSEPSTLLHDIYPTIPPTASSRSPNSPFYHAQPTAQQVAQLTLLYVGYISSLFFFALILFWVCFRQLGDPNLDFGLVVLYELESGPHILMEDECSDQWLTPLPWA